MVRSTLLDEFLRVCPDHVLRRLKLIPRQRKHLYRACTYEYMRRMHDVLQHAALQPWPTGASQMQNLLNGGDAEQCPTHTIHVVRLCRSPLYTLLSYSNRSDSPQRVRPPLRITVHRDQKMRVHAAYRLPLEETQRLRSHAPTVLALIY